MTDREFDIIVYGATGYTGRLVAEYLLAHAEGRRWAMAGRSADKLAAVRDEIGAPGDTPCIVADVADPDSVAAMAARTHVVITTVGPYQLYGEPLVAACASAGTAYVDLCGEPAWMRAMIDTYDAAAKSSGARIVFSCGFDSIPFDLGVLFAQDRARLAWGAPARQVRGRVIKMQGTFSGGTAASGRETFAAAMRDPAVRALLQSPFALTPGFDGAPQPSGSKPKYDEAMGSWLAPFFMAPINTKNVHRTNFLLGQPYGADFAYEEMMATGPGEKGEAAARALAAANPMADENGPKPGEGPTQAEREAGHYDLLFRAEAADGRTLGVRVTGDMDPGYGSTSKMIAQSALCLLDEAKDLPGGIYTPGAAFGMTLVPRLERLAGLKFAAA
jgi:short subunit dehydrogenase-like uncharacterized protein